MPVVIDDAGQSSQAYCSTLLSDARSERVLPASSEEDLSYNGCWLGKRLLYFSASCVSLLISTVL